MTNARYANPVLFVILAGVVGGSALIATTLLTRRGPMIFLPYAALTVAVALYLYWRRIDSFGIRFNASLGAFMIATIILQAYTIVIVNPAALHTPLWHKIWPLGVFLLIGSALGAVVAKVTPTSAESQS